MDLMNWKVPAKKTMKKQRELFVELTEDQKAIISILQLQDSVHIDDVYLKSGLSSSSVAAALLTLEMEGIIASLPGKLYRLT